MKYQKTGFRRRRSLAIVVLIAARALGAPMAGVALPETSGRLQPQSRLARLAFGSCLDENQSHQALITALEADPDLFLFLGDNVYADGYFPAVIRRAYERLGESTAYQLLQAETEVLAVWDDHDYGVNDSGREYRSKEASEALFLDFWGVGPDDPRRQRPGIYTSYLVGPPGADVQLILLDTRYFRAPTPRVEKREAGKGPYGRARGADMTILGKAQWEWLQDELTRPASLRIIASSTQVLAEHHGWESWANFPEELDRLLEMVGTSLASPVASGDGDGEQANDSGGGPPVLFLTGDRHFSEISRRTITARGAEVPLYDITSSSMNIAYPADRPTPNEYRVGSFYLGTNFAELEIQWPRKAETDGGRVYPIAASVRVRTPDGRLAFAHTF